MAPGLLRSTETILITIHHGIHSRLIDTLVSVPFMKTKRELMFQENSRLYRPASFEWGEVGCRI